MSNPQPAPRPVPELLPKRKHLVARMAGNIAAGLVQTGWVEDSYYGPDTDKVVDKSIDIAEAILKKLGI